MKVSVRVAGRGQLKLGGLLRVKMLFGLDVGVFWYEKHTLNLLFRSWVNEWERSKGGRSLHGGAANVAKADEEDFGGCHDGDCCLLLMKE